MAGFKMIGMVLIISSMGAWGLSSARGIGKRTEELREIRFAMAFLEKEITYMHTPLTRALERTAGMSHQPVSVLFLESATSLKAGKGLTAGEAWMNGLQKLNSKSNLAPTDLEILATAAHHLGASDSSDQRKFLVLLQEEIKVQEERARQEQGAKQKLWSYGGFIMGIVIVLLLI